MQVIMPSGAELNGPPEVMRRFLAQGGHMAHPIPREPAKVPTDRRVRVLAVVHGWFPGLAAGSERMMQHLLAALPPDGFDIHVLSFGIQADPIFEQTYEYEGVPVTVGFEPPIDPDLIITHHGIAARVLPSYYEMFPHAHVISVYHNERYDIPDIEALDADLKVFNTKWVKDALRSPGIVVRPPLEFDRHFVENTGDAVTLVNLQENKGVAVFAELAAQLPDVAFLGVKGTHGEQWNVVEPNVLTVDTTQDMREVWRRTKVLLMPSEYESYGMVAAEACASGIPVIANPTPGLIECLDWAGIFVPRDDVDGWERALSLLLTDAEHYRVHSAQAALRGRELVSQSQTELSRFLRRVRKLVRE
jgi:hypothetical protein